MCLNVWMRVLLHIDPHMLLFAWLRRVEERLLKLSTRVSCMPLAAAGRPVLYYAVALTKRPHEDCRTCPVEHAVNLCAVSP